MIALNNEDIPMKKDESTNVELTMDNPTESTSDDNKDTAEMNTTTTAPNGNTTSTGARLLNVHFQQKTKYLREMWSNHKVKLDKDHSQLLVICLITTIGILCSLASLLTNYWISDSKTNVKFGIWNTCWQEKYMVAPEFNQTWGETNNGSMVVEGQRWMCARQGVYDVSISPAEKWRVDQVFASQGLLVSGTVMYVFSVVMLSLTYRFIGLNRLNIVRNTLVISMFAQMVAFLMQLIGYFLFIFTDRASISIALLFVYFGLTIFASNIINFITIEYKAYKIRQMNI